MSLKALTWTALGGRGFRLPQVLAIYRANSTAQQTLEVKDIIHQKREAAYQGGGPKRIQGQHKKVIISELRLKKKSE
jgi:hypothetical protein